MSNVISGMPVYAPYPTYGYPQAPAAYAPGYGQPVVYAPDTYQSSMPTYGAQLTQGYGVAASNPFSALASLFSGILGFFRKPKATAAAPAASPAPSPQQTQASDAEFLAGLYRQILGREPDAEGFAGWSNALRNGMARQAVIAAFQNSPEARQRAVSPAPVSVPQPTPVSVPYPTTQLPTTPTASRNPFGSEAALEAAVQHAAKRALETALERNGGTLPQMTSKPQEDAFYYGLITMVIAQLRLQGFEVERLARHTSIQPGNPSRYVNDAVVLPDGRAIDLYGGDGTLVQFHDLDVPSPKTDRNTGITDPNLPPSSSTLGL